MMRYIPSLHTPFPAGGSVRWALPALFAVVVAVIGCGGSTSGNPDNTGSLGAPTDAPLWFVNVASEAGVRWRCAYGTDETDYILETTGPGPAWLDYDNDGDLDLYLLNGSHFDPDTLAKYRPRSALYRNNGDGTFSDVTDEAGVGFEGWGGGTVAADFDNDGYADLYLSNSYGANVLYRNNGDGTFTDVTARAGVGDTLYGASTCALDYDLDGFLDIFVVNYVPFDTAAAEKPGSSRYSIVRGVPMSTAPEGYTGAPDRLYHNNGDGTFSEVSDRVGMNAIHGRGLGATSLDYNDDGRPDLYVTNDAMQNFLYRNNGDGTFTDVALMTGTAYGEGGIPAGSMGVTAGDVNNDGWPELLVANYEDQTPSVYFNTKGRFFTDRGVACGIGGPSLIPLQWGLVLADLNLDGARDVYIAGGHVSSRLEVRYPHSRFQQTNHVFINDGTGAFRDVCDEAGPGMDVNFGSRGAAAADYDNDGDYDIAVTEKSGPFTLLRNDTERRGNGWLRLVLVARKSASGGIGARIRVVAGNLVQRAEVRAGSSYASTEDPRPLFGLGNASGADTVEIRWPSGRIDTMVEVPVNATIRVTEGVGHEPVIYP